MSIDLSSTGDIYREREAHKEGDEDQAGSLAEQNGRGVELACLADLNHADALLPVSESLSSDSFFPSSPGFLTSKVRNRNLFPLVFRNLNRNLFERPCRRRSYIQSPCPSISPRQEIYREREAHKEGDEDQAGSLAEQNGQGVEFACLADLNHADALLPVSESLSYDSFFPSSPGFFSSKVRNRNLFPLVFRNLYRNLFERPCCRRSYIQSPCPSISPRQKI